MSEKQNKETRQKNEGEGSRSAARSYNQKTEDFARSGKVSKAAQAAKEAVENDAGELKKAEDKGRERAKEFDPAVKRDRSKS